MCQTRDHPYPGWGKGAEEGLMGRFGATPLPCSRQGLKAEGPALCRGRWLFQRKQPAGAGVGAGRQEAEASGARRGCSEPRGSELVSRPASQPHRQETP